MRAHTFVLAALSLSAALSIPMQAQAPPVLETYTATLQVKGPTTATTTVQIVLNRYTSDADREAVQKGLKHGGYPGFLTALRNNYKAGTVAHGDRTWTIRWASAKTTPQGKAIVLIADQPIHFLGNGSTAEPKPRAGYEVAVIQMELDGTGAGKGTLAAAAKVKAGGDQGVIVDDYGESGSRS